MTDIEIKCEIIEEFVRGNTLPDGSYTYREVQEFVRVNDLGVPLAQANEYGLATLTERGEEVINATWADLCELVGVDPHAEYLSIRDMLNG